MTRSTDNLELILFGWVDALRRSQPDPIAPRLAADIVWQGLRADLVWPAATRCWPTSATAATCAATSKASKPTPSMTSTSCS